jgi:hypothetical protein
MHGYSWDGSSREKRFACRWHDWLVFKRSSRTWGDRNVGMTRWRVNVIAMARGGKIDLTDEERELLRRGLLEWGGPARCTEAMAVAIGFSSVTDLLDEGRRIADDLLAGRALMKNDWRRALLATEIVFVSDVLGSGVDWSTTTGMDDDETVRMLRSVQRKLAGVLRVTRHDSKTLPGTPCLLASRVLMSRE